MFTDSTEKIDHNLRSFTSSKAIQSLAGDQESIREYYNQRANTYNQDTSKKEYLGPSYIATYFDRISKQDGPFLNLNDSKIEILDSGCGTGLVGKELSRRGYQNIDGFDIAPSMVEQAQKTQVYRDLIDGCDMNQRIEAYEDNRYDAAISCGVFILGLVLPSAIVEMVRVTKPGGLVMVSTRKSYYDSTDFQCVCDRLVSENKVSLVSCIMNGPYLAEACAHYWAFKVL